jgi:hypothetical protein
VVDITIAFPSCSNEKDASRAESFQSQSTISVKQWKLLLAVRGAMSWKRYHNDLPGANRSGGSESLI